MGASRSDNGTNAHPLGHQVRMALCATVILGQVRPPHLQSPSARPQLRHVVLLARPPRYQQIYVSSCETAATHIALLMYGVKISERQLISELPMDRRPPKYGDRGTVVRWGDPYQAFVGDIRSGDTWPLEGYGVYVPPILRLLRRHGMTGSWGGSRLTLSILRHALDAGHPVIVWVPKLSLYAFKPTLIRQYWTTWQGRRVVWNVNEHAQVLVGYDSSGFYLDNPDFRRFSHGAWLWHYSVAQFQRGWSLLADQAIVVIRRLVHRAPILSNRGLHVQSALSPHFAASQCRLRLTFPRHSESAG